MHGRHRHRFAPPPRRCTGGFTLVECLAVLAMLAVLGVMAYPSLRAYDFRAGRLDAVEALTRVQVAQEKHRNAHGLYAAELQALAGASAQSPQGRYAIRLESIGPEAYLALARAVGAQAEDPGCATITLQVKQGFAQIGPHAGCWHR
jgi:type IV pilus assembly protein PilE